MGAYISTDSGDWSDTGIWDGDGGPPGDGDTYTIALAHIVDIDQDVTVGTGAGNAGTILGHLRIENPASNYTMVSKGNIYVNGGRLSLGTVANPLSEAERFVLHFDCTGGAFTITKNGTTYVIMQGAVARTGATTLSTDAAATQADIVCSDVTGWQNGDTLMVAPKPDAGTRGAQAPELMTIQSIAGSTVTLTGNLTNKHRSGAHVRNMSGEVTVEAINATGGNLDDGAVNDGDWDWDGVHFKNFKRLYTTTMKLELDNCTLESFSDTNSSPYINNAAPASRKTWSNCAVYLSDKTAYIWGNNFTLSGWHFGNLHQLFLWDYSTSLTNEIVVSGCKLYGGNYGGILPKGVLSYGGLVEDCAFQSVVTGYSYGSSGGGARFDGCSFDQCVYGIWPASMFPYRLFKDCTFDDCGHGIRDRSGISLRLQDCTFGGTVVNGVDIEVTRGSIVGDNVTLASATQVNVVDTRGIVSISRLGGTNANKTWTYYGTYERETGTVRGGSNGAKMTPSSTTGWLEMPFGGPDEDMWGALRAEADKELEIGIYLRKTQAQGAGDRPTLEVEGAGITLQTAEMTDVNDTWELVTITATPTRDGIVKVRVKALKTVVQNYVYVDDGYATQDDGANSYRRWEMVGDDWQFGSPSFVPLWVAQPPTLLGTSIEALTEDTVLVTLEEEG